MKPDAIPAVPRINFFKLAGAAGVCGLSQTGFAAAAKRVCLIVDPENSTAVSMPTMRAIAYLGEALGAKGVKHELRGIPRIGTPRGGNRDQKPGDVSRASNAELRCPPNRDKVSSRGPMKRISRCIVAYGFLCTTPRLY